MPHHVNTLKGHVDAVILTIRKDEDDAVAARLGKMERTTGGRSYRVAKIPGADGDLTVALLRLTEPGNGPAQDAASDAIHELKPRMLILVGIAGAVPAPEFTLGDVMVATRIADLRVQALVPDTLPQLDLRGERVHKKLADRLNNLIEPQGWAGSIMLPRPSASLDSDLFKGSETWNEKVARSLKASGHRKHPVYFTGTVGSSDFLVKDPTALAHWLQSSRKVETVEMEAAGVMEAAARLDAAYPVLVVRGISDVVGYERDPAWTVYACQSAAAFVVALLCSSQLDDIRPYHLEQLDNVPNEPSMAKPDSTPARKIISGAHFDGIPILVDGPGCIDSLLKLAISPTHLARQLRLTGLRNVLALKRPGDPARGDSIEFYYHKEGLSATLSNPQQKQLFGRAKTDVGVYVDIVDSREAIAAAITDRLRSFAGRAKGALLVSNDPDLAPLLRELRHSLRIWLLQISEEPPSELQNEAYATLALRGDYLELFDYRYKRAHVEELDEDILAEIFSEADDRKYNQLRVDHGGNVYFYSGEDRPDSGVRFRFEGFSAYHGYVGPKAASDAEYIGEHLQEITLAWSHEVGGYIDCPVSVLVGARPAKQS